MKSEDVFSPFGLLKNTFPEYSYRPGQEDMAVKVETAFREKRGAIIEAGTGIGKSFAYLVPSFLLVSGDPDVRVVISTSTITLQKQLYDKDIPFLKNILKSDVKTAILYGRSNYICRKKLGQLRESSGLLSFDSSLPESRLLKWCQRTRTGCLLDIHDRDEARIASALRCDENDCISRRCPYYQDCFFYNARRYAQSARIIVTNHHVVLVDAAIRWENGEDFSEATILPGYTHLVMDEAHHIESEATSLFSEKFSLDELKGCLDYLSFRRNEMGGKSLMEFLSVCDISKDRMFTMHYSAQENRIKAKARLFMNTVRNLIASYSSERSVLLDAGFYSMNRTHLQEGKDLVTEIRNLSENLVNLLSSDSDVFLPFLESVTKTAGKLSSLSSTLSSFLSFNEFDSRISYAPLLPDGDYEIVNAPLLPGPLIRQRLLDKLSSFLFCSATLSVGGSFSFFRERLAIDKDDCVIEGVYYSPFEYRKNLMYLVPQDARPYVNGDREYIGYAASAIENAIMSSGGGALVLFTSVDMMRKVYAIVNSRIGEKTELLIQDRETSRSMLLSKFKSHKDSSLFAVSSFWEGVDAPGDTLRLLVIVKLPFDVPSDPVNRARSEFVNRTMPEKGSFVTLTLPNAMIKMKQGVGRLIRSENDRGVVLFLDGRIIRKFYSRLLFSSIPEGYYPEDTLCENIGGKIESFLF